jgi:uncharacterized protein DUF1707
MNSPAVPERGHLRASDADRERVAEILRQAAGDGRLTLEELDERLDAVYTAKTYAELEPLTRDLPQPGTAQAHVPAQASQAADDPARFGGQPGSTTAIAILGGFTRKGDWVVPREFTAFAFMGGGEIDMREARFEQQSVTLHLVAIMGGFEVTVPDDATVHANGIGIMGGFDHGASGGGTPGGPVITINGFALMGGVEVKRKRSRQDKLEKLAAKLDAKIEKLERKSRELE